MEQIFQKAWVRFKKSFLRYFLVFILGFGASILSILGYSLLAGLFFLVYYLAGKLVFVGGLLVFVYLVLFILGMWYLSSWIQLATIVAILDQKVTDVTQCYKKTRSSIFDFIIFSLLNGLFILGLLYTNVFFFIPYILWAIWSTFAKIAFIEGHRGGLTPLWYSRAKVRGNFWKVLSYLMVLNLAIYLLTFFLSQLNDVFSYLNILIWFVFAPFVISFTVELYKSLPTPKKYKPSTAWIILSVIGWVLTPVLLFFVFSSVLRNPSFIQQLEKEVKSEKMFEQFQQYENSSQFNSDLDTQIN